MIHFAQCGLVCKPNGQKNIARYTNVGFSRLQICSFRFADFERYEVRCSPARNSRPIRVLLPQNNVIGCLCFKNILQLPDSGVNEIKTKDVNKENNSYKLSFQENGRAQERPQIFNCEYSISLPKIST